MISYISEFFSIIDSDIIFSGVFISNSIILWDLGYNLYHNYSYSGCSLIFVLMYFFYHSFIAFFDNGFIAVIFWSLTMLKYIFHNSLSTSSNFNFYNYFSHISSSIWSFISYYFSILNLSYYFNVSNSFFFSSIYL